MTASMVSGQARPVKLVRARAGTGAVYNFGMRRVSPSRAGRESSEEAGGGSRTAPVVEPRLFSQPSSSFNASSWVSSGLAPPLGGRSAAGVGEGYKGRSMERKTTAVIMPGQGSQYVTMAHDLYQQFASAREVWKDAEDVLTAFRQGQSGSASANQRAFEEQLSRGVELEHSVVPSSLGIHDGWFRELAFSGSQLELTRSENAMPAVLATTLSFLQVLRSEFGVDLVKEHVEWAAGHGSGTYAALVSAGVMSAPDALRAMRYRGLEVMKCFREHPVLFPPGCERPDSVYETWGFANQSSGQGRALALSKDGQSDPKDHPFWRGTQMSAVVLRQGALDRALEEVAAVLTDIHRGDVDGVSRDEYVAVSNVNSQIQIVLAGTIVGVNYACDRLMYKGIGARAVNVPVSGPCHTSFVQSASDAFDTLIDKMSLQAPGPLRVTSSVSGQVLNTADDVRQDLRGALCKPVRWLQTIDTLVEQGVRRFVCLGPGRAIAQQLSKEMALRERAMARCADAGARARQGTLDADESMFEVWSVATAEGVRINH